MIFYENITAGDTVYIPFNSNDQAGGRVDPSDAFEANDFYIYKDGGTTERSSTSGVTISSTFDTKTGLHMLTIDTSDNTDAGFYSSGSTFHIALYPDTETIDTQDVAHWIGGFTLV